MYKKTFTRLNITHKWRKWEPKKGTYAGMTKYICETNMKSDSYGGKPVILAGYKKRDGTPHMHFHSISLWQFENNTSECTDKDIINEFEELFPIYKKNWEERRIVKTAKALLSVYK